MKTKVCVLCKERKDWSEFYLRRSGPLLKNKRPGPYCQPCHKAKNSELRKGPCGVREPVAPTLPAAPFIGWLKAERHKYDSGKAMCREIGMPERRLWALLHAEQDRVFFDVVDKALSRVSMLRVDDLYSDEEITESLRPRSGPMRNAA